MLRKIASSLLVVLMLAGCSPSVSRSEYAEFQNALRTDPKLRRLIVDGCRQDFARMSPAERRNMAQVAGVSVARAPTVVCQRIFRAIANGRISYQEFTSRSGGYGKWIAVVAGA